jgi:hypothetical protein
VLDLALDVAIGARVVTRSAIVAVSRPTESVSGPIADEAFDHFNVVLDRVRRPANLPDGLEHLSFGPLKRRGCLTLCQAKGRPERPNGEPEHRKPHATELRQALLVV